MKVVKNNMVDMQWDADGFVETKKMGFIAAVHRYGNVAVAFKDGKVYTHVDDDGECIDFNALVKVIKNAVKERDDDYPDFYEDYAEIYDGREFMDETVTFLNLEDQKDDILARLKDLSGYWHVVEVDINNL